MTLLEQELFQKLGVTYQETNGSYEACLRQAESIVSKYRDEAPEGFDPKNDFGIGAVIAIIAIIAALASAGVGAYGAKVSSDAQKDAADYNAEVAKNNAIAARQQGEFESQRIQDRNKRLRGSQSSAYLKSGVTLTGSAQDVMYDSAIEGELDVLSVNYKSQLDQNSQGASSTIYKLQGQGVQEAGIYATTGAALGGIGGAANAYGSYQNTQARQSANPILKSQPTMRGF